MGKSGAFICLLILAMDVIAGVLSIQAQIKKNKAVMKSHETKIKSVEYYNCDEESSRIISETIFRLVLAATLLFAIAHITANLLGGCMCLCSAELELQTSSSNIQLCFACLISSWIIAAVGFTVMIIGMLQNSSRSHGSCRMIHNHSLLIGGIFCFLHCLFCIAFYVTATVSFGKQRTNETHHHQPHP